MLQQIAEYNDISSELLKKLQDKIESFGKVVKYRFDIEQENPDKTFYNGKTIFPGIYTLRPAVFNITDNDEKRAGKSKFKKIALIKSHESNGTGGYKTEFIKIRVPATARGQLRLNLETPEDIAKCMLIELHPKLSGGMFADKETRPLINRIDDVQEARTQTEERAEKRKAANAVADMDEKSLIQFADAMNWDSTQDPVVLRNLAEELADDDPKFLNDLVSNKTFEIRAIVKQALDREIIAYDPVEYKITWAGNKQTITVLSPSGEQSEIVKFAEYLHTGGLKAEEALKKITQLVKEKKGAVA
jgi:hypothetical protein